MILRAKLFAQSFVKSLVLELFKALFDFPCCCPQLKYVYPIKFVLFLVFLFSLITIKSWIPPFSTSANGEAIAAETTSIGNQRPISAE